MCFEELIASRKKQIEETSENWHDFVSLVHCIDCGILCYNCLEWKIPQFLSS